MITHIMAVLIAVVLLVLIVGFLALKLLRLRDDEDPFEDQDDYFSGIQDAIKDDEGDQVEGQLKLWETGQMPIALEPDGFENVQQVATTELRRQAYAALLDEASAAAEITPPTAMGSSPTAGTDAAGTAAPAGATPTTEWMHEWTEEEVAYFKAHVAQAHKSLATEVHHIAPTESWQDSVEAEIEHLDNVIRNWWDDVDPEAILAAAELAATPLPQPSMEEEVADEPEAVSVAPAPVQDVPEVESTQQWSARVADEANLWNTQQAAERKQWRGEMGLSDEGDEAYPAAA